MYQKCPLCLGFPQYPKCSVCDGAKIISSVTGLPPKKEQNENYKPINTGDFRDMVETQKEYYGK